MGIDDKPIERWEDLGIPVAWATKEQEQAEIALKKLSQLMKNANGGWLPDWTDDEKKYVIVIANEIEVDEYMTYSFFLAFKTEEIRDTFLKNHISLIEQARPLL